MAEYNAIYTIGYGRRTFDEFAALLKANNIEYLVDTRSQPHSRWKPAFNRHALAKSLNEHGITYIFLGDSLGGRPADESCYPGGPIDYSIVRSKDWFLAGIERLQIALHQGHPVAIMCAEQKPEECHRTLLIGEELHTRGVVVIHIDEHGELRSHDAIMERVRTDGSELFGR